VIELELVLELNAGVELELEDGIRCLSVGRVIPLEAIGERV
jgi:hypothetical protein